MKRTNRQAGFTLVEMVAVVAILGVLLLIAGPNLLAYQRTGQFVQRSQTARTIFLAAQQALTDARPTSAWSQVLAQGGTVDLDTILPPVDAQEKSDNAGRIRYLRICADGSGDDVLWSLLEPYLSTDLLSHSILVEYNTQTAVVRSVFYSQRAGYLTYTGGVEEKTNVLSREETRLKAKEQGYYGVDYTGTRGSVRPLSAPQVSLVNGEKLLVRWTDVTPVANNGEMVTYRLLLTDAATGNILLEYVGIPNYFGVDVLDSHQSEMVETFLPDGTGLHLYREIYEGNPCLVLVLDCIHHPLHLAYPDMPLANVQAHVEARAAGVEPVTGSSRDAVHNTFADGRTVQGQGVYGIANPRHLNNIRYGERDAQYLQRTATIDWRMAEEGENLCENDLPFDSIAFPFGDPFTGSYRYAPQEGEGGSYGTLRRLTIYGEENRGAGLFCQLDGARLEGIALEQLNLEGEGPTGAFAGMARDASLVNCHLLGRGEQVEKKTITTPGVVEGVTTWNNRTQYKVGDLVEYKGAYYRCLRNMKPGDVGKDAWEPGHNNGHWSQVEEGDLPGTPPVTTVTGLEIRNPLAVTVQEGEVVWAGFSTISPGESGKPVGGLLGQAENCALVYCGVGGAQIAGGVLSAQENPYFSTQDFPVYDYTLEDGSPMVGGLVGELLGGRIEGVLFRGTVAGSEQVGGLAGWTEGTILGESLRSEGQVAGGYRVGGLFGSGGFQQLTGLENHSAVSGDSCVGGITGQLLENCRLADSVNYGLVRAWPVWEEALGEVGGLVGRAYTNSTIVNCENRAAGWQMGIQREEKAPRPQKDGLPEDEDWEDLPLFGSDVGGIAGFSEGSVQNCRFAGVVFGEENVGGIVGTHTGRNLGSSLTQKITGCEMNGWVVGRESVGGIVGRNQGTVQNCQVATGLESPLPDGPLVVGEDQVGGLIGWNDRYGTLDYGADASRRSSNGSVRNKPDALTQTEERNGSPTGKTVSLQGLLQVISYPNGGSYTGGFIGLDEHQQTHDMTDAGLLFTGYENYAYVSGSHWVGGIVGSSRYASFDGCENHGYVEKRSSRGEAGGIVGSLRNSGQTLENSANYGRVSSLVGSSPNWEEADAIGGVAGAVQRGRVVDCLNGGLVENPWTTGGSQRLGGVIGYLDSGSTLEGCVNSAAVLNWRSGGTGSSGTGGLVGATASTAQIRGGENQAQAVLWSTGTRTGGLVGQLGGSLSDSINRADLLDLPANMVGGLVGQVNSGAQVENSSSCGRVRFTGETTGGLVGNLSGRMENCRLDLRDQGEVTLSGGRIFGGLVGQVGTSGQLFNCTAQAAGRVLLTGGQYTGGIAGASSGRIQQVNLGDGLVEIQGGMATGGVVGHFQGGSLVGISTGENLTVTGQQWVGGIVGELSSSLPGPEGTALVNRAAVFSKLGNAGGIAGQSNREDVSIRQAINYGPVTAVHSNVGGILGWHQRTGSLEDCSNYGKVLLSTTEAGSHNAGGILGSASRGVTIQNCTNYGWVENRSQQTAAGIVAGGMASRLSNCRNYREDIYGEGGAAGIAYSLTGGEVLDCQNLPYSASGLPLPPGSDGARPQPRMAAGILAAANGKTTISGCENHQQLEAPGDCAGLVLQLSGESVLLYGENYGAITGGGNAAGLVGTVASGAQVKGRRNFASVTGQRYVGGIVSVNNGTVAACQNLLPSLSPGETRVVAVQGGRSTAAGGIAGKNTGRIWGDAREWDKFQQLLAAEEERLASATPQEQEPFAGLQFPEFEEETPRNEMSVQADGQSALGGLVGINSGLLLDGVNVGWVTHRGQTTGADSGGLGGIAGSQEGEGQLVRCINLGQMSYPGLRADAYPASDHGLVGRRAQGADAPEGDRVRFCIYRFTNPQPDDPTALLPGGGVSYPLDRDLPQQWSSTVPYPIYNQHLSRLTWGLSPGEQDVDYTNPDEVLDLLNQVLDGWWSKARP